MVPKRERKREGKRFVCNFFMYISRLIMSSVPELSKQLHENGDSANTGKKALDNTKARSSLNIVIGFKNNMGFPAKTR